MLYFRFTFLLLALIVFHSIAKAETYTRQINWLPAKIYYAPDAKKITAATFEGAEPDPGNGYRPLYHELLSLSASSELQADIRNAQYAPLEVNMTGDFPEKIEVHVAQVWIRKKPYAEISFVPIRKNPSTGQLEKLVSFSLDINSTPMRGSRGLRNYAAHSVLSSGTWWKIAVTQSGVYKLDFDFLKNQLNIDLTKTDFSRIGVFGYGGMVPEDNSTTRYDDLPEIASYIYDANNNNRCEPGDYILFYARGPHTWSWNNNNKRFEHLFNIYSDKACYFVSPDRGTGKRLGVQASVGTPNVIVNEFDDYAFHEKDEFNLLSSGRMWLGDRMNNLNPSKSISFNFPHLITSAPVKLVSYVAANSPYNSTFNISANGTTVLTQNVSKIDAGPYTDVFHFSVNTTSFSTTSSNINLSYSFTNPDANSSSSGYINYVELNVKRALTMSGAFMPFRAVGAVGSSNVAQYNLTNANSNTQIWEISDVTNVTKIEGILNGSQFSVTVPSGTLKEFIAVDVAGSFATPEKIGSVTNQNLHAIGQPDMLIITASELLNAANDLAAFHRTHDKLDVKVVLCRDIYNEFSSGQLDVSAIRDFIKMLYDRAGSDTSKFPDYVCLFGDGSFDPKDRLSDNNNLVPTYQSNGSKNILSSFVSDDFYVCLDDAEDGNMENGGNKLDAAIGRIIAADNSEAQGIVDKIKRYKNPQSLGAWRNMLTTIGDDEDGNIHQNQANHLGDYVRLNYPAYNNDKILLDAYQQQTTPAGDRYPDVNSAILNRINSGTLILSYTGHGGVNNWAHERIFNMSDIKNLKNTHRLPLFITATCDFSAFDNPGYKTAGEFLITNSNGGAIASLTTVRPVYSDGNNILQNALYSKLFENYRGRKPTVGELTTRTKNQILNTTTTNTRCFVLLGDPALTLNYPQWNIVTTTVNNVPVAQPHDSLKALSKITIQGEVRDWNGNLKTDFNGTCYPIVFDKLNSFTTLGNDPQTPKATYQAYRTVLFKGQCTVNQGRFQFTFIVPKDINYQYGYGRISYYADNGNNMDAHGYQNNIVVGGSADSFAADNDGPKLRLFMNDEKFVFGGTTNENPNLLAILSDQSGINTSGNGLGHDISAVLDLNTKNPIILNDHYQTDKDSFRTGRVLYPFSKLSEGRHNLRVKAWDIHNNSAEDYTEFIVASSAKLALAHVLNYPNPFTTKTNFMFEHNRPGDNLHVTVQIYSVSGRLVKTLQRNIVSEGYRVNDLTWDGLDDYGSTIGKGTYVYKVNVRDSQGNSANKFEKLVVLR